MFGCVLAMAPPVPVVARVFIAWIMAALAIALVRLAGHRKWDPGVLVPAGIISAVAVVVMQALLPSSYGGGLHDRGILAAIVGALVGTICVRVFLPNAEIKGPEGSRWRRLKLSLAGAVLGRSSVLGWDVWRCCWRRAPFGPRVDARCFYGGGRDGGSDRLLCHRHDDAHSPLTPHKGYAASSLPSRLIRRVSREQCLGLMYQRL
jgi:hypothetical protein